MFGCHEISCYVMDITLFSIAISQEFICNCVTRSFRDFVAFFRKNFGGIVSASALTRQMPFLQSLSFSGMSETQGNSSI